MLTIMDRAFFAFHTLLIAFNMVGWAWRRTRPAHLIVLGLTAFSWFVMGAYFGWGYCLCTDWHFRIRRGRGIAVPESSFIQLLASQALGIQLSRRASDALAVGVFTAIVIATAFAWTIEVRRRTSVRTGRLPVEPDPPEPE